MKVDLQALTVLLPSCWLVCAILHGMAFGGDGAPRVDGLRRHLLRATLVLHLITFIVRWREVDHFPISDTWTTLSAVAFSTGLLYAWLAGAARHAGSGGIVLGLVFLLQLTASAFGPLGPATRTTGVDAFRILHVSTSVLAAASLILSGVHGLLYLVLFRRMRERRFGPLFRHLPDLDLLVRMTRRAAFAGFAFSTVGLNVGIWMAHDKNVPGFGYADPHVIVTLVLWLHFGAIAFSGKIRGFTARRASFAAMAGLVALLFSLFLTLFPGITFHSTP
jgi:ABC-type transport system involved in cytochrome c biogenesis permease subunit